MYATDVVNVTYSTSNQRNTHQCETLIAKLEIDIVREVGTCLKLLRVHVLPLIV